MTGWKPGREATGCRGEASPCTSPSADQGRLAELQALTPPELLSHQRIDDSFWMAIQAAYAGPRRHYHSIEHVVEVAQRFSEFRAAWQRPKEVYLAVLLHDAVYVPGRQDNELRSSLLVEELLGHSARRTGEPLLDLDQTRSLIIASSRHGDSSRQVCNGDEALFLDCDCGIFGAPAARYQEYLQGVRLEYQDVYAEALYRLGRAAFIRQMLAGDQVFLTSWFNQRYGAQARRNLSQELFALTGEQLRIGSADSSCSNGSLEGAASPLGEQSGHHHHVE